MTDCPICKESVDVVGGRMAPHGDCPGGYALLAKADTYREDRYTDPTDWCPHPERWTSADWDSTENEVCRLVGAFVLATQPDLVIETGSAFGFSAFQIGAALKTSGHGVLHTIEISPERAEKTRIRCSHLPVVVEQMSSLDFTPPGEVGFAWFDSLMELRIPEFERYYPHMADGAIVGFHDVGDGSVGGNKLYEQILNLEAAGMLLPIRLRTPRGVCFAEVVK